MIHDRLGMAVGSSMGVFYAYYVMIGSQSLEWIQEAINVLIRLLCRFRLMSNVAKSKSVTCPPGAIFTGVSEEVFSQMITGGGATCRERLCICIPFMYCGLELTYGSMTAHCRQLHGTDP